MHVSLKILAARWVVPGLQSTIKLTNIQSIWLNDMILIDVSPPIFWYKLFFLGWIPRMPSFIRGAICDNLTWPGGIHSSSWTVTGRNDEIFRVSSIPTGSGLLPLPLMVYCNANHYIYCHRFFVVYCSVNPVYVILQSIGSNGATVDPSNSLFDAPISAKDSTTRRKVSADPLTSGCVLAAKRRKARLSLRNGKMLDGGTFPHHSWDWRTSEWVLLYLWQRCKINTPDYQTCIIRDRCMTGNGENWHWRRLSAVYHHLIIDILKNEIKYPQLILKHILSYIIISMNPLYREPEKKHHDIHPRWKVRSVLKSSTFGTSSRPKIFKASRHVQVPFFVNVCWCLTMKRLFNKVWSNK